MADPKEITREEANKVLIEASKGPRQQATICYAGKWYDTRGMSGKEIEIFITTLLGRPVGPKEQAWIGPCASCKRLIKGNPRAVCSCGDIYCEECVSILSPEELKATIENAAAQGHTVSLLSPEAPI